MHLLSNVLLSRYVYVRGEQHLHPLLWYSCTYSSISTHPRNQEGSTFLPFSFLARLFFFFFFFFFLSTTVCRNRKRELCICTTIYVCLLHSNQPSRGRNKPVANVVETFNRAVAAIGENDDTPSILYRPIE